MERSCVVGLILVSARTDGRRTNYCLARLSSFPKLYTVISDKLVGILLRTRKHQLTYFEGEVLFQKRDDDVPIFLMQPIEDIRSYCDNKALQARRSVSPMPN